jgi:hypothetical protein
MTGYTENLGIVFPVLGRIAGGVDGAGCARGAVIIECTNAPVY